MLRRTSACLVIGLFSLLALLLLLRPAPQVNAAAAEPTETYLVELIDPPAAVRRPTGGGKFDARSAEARAYVATLDTRRAAVLRAARTALARPTAPSFVYRYAVNGFALDLTAAEAAALALLPGVARVAPLPDLQLQTDAGPAWVAAPPIWGGSVLTATQGEGVVVGVIDTGINLAHPSFADVGGDGYDHDNPRGRYYGLCDPAYVLPEAAHADLTHNPAYCNDKLIGVYVFSRSKSTPDDVDGHGSHVASTAVGNVLSATYVAPTTAVTATISGVAPHANLILYGVEDASGGCCAGDALLAAIDQAVADGVDVINFSIGGGERDPWRDLYTQVWLNVYEAGIIPVTSAGNRGPNPATMGSPGNMPWLVAVAAASHTRRFEARLTAIQSAGGATLTARVGQALTAAYGPAAVVYAADVPSALTATPGLCGVGAQGSNSSPWPANTFQGEIVICNRGTYGRVEKGINVMAAGAGGMVLVDAGIETNADPHVLPALHITQSEGAALIDFVRAQAAAGHTTTARISATAAQHSAANADVLANFSSRGPALVVNDVLKPQVSAPGIDIWAATAADPNAAGPTFALLSGTSMSSPHVAGCAALLRAIHPTWTNGEIASALTTSAVAGSRKQDRITPADPFDVGGGRLVCAAAARAGLVLDETRASFAAADPLSAGDPSALNLAGLQQDACLTTCRWVRTVRSTATTTVTWTPAVDGAAGLLLSVAPPTLTLAPGATASFTVTANMAALPIGAWQFGSVTWQPDDGGVNAERVVAARFPLAARRLAVTLPTNVRIVTDDGEQGQTLSGLRAPQIDALQLPVYGPVLATPVSGTLAVDPSAAPYDNLAQLHVVKVNVPADARRLAAEIAADAGLQLDIFMGVGDTPSPAGERCRDTAPGQLARCSVLHADLTPGAWWIAVQNRGADVADYTLHYAVVPAADSGTLTVSGPSRVVEGDLFQLDLAVELPAVLPGERWYAAFAIGSDAEHADDIGTVPVDVVVTPTEALALGGQPVTFYAGVPADWQLRDGNDSGLTWGLTGYDSCAPDPVNTAYDPTINVTGGGGSAACVSSYNAGTADFDAQLWTPLFDLTGSDSCTDVVLSFSANYQNYAGFDKFDVDIIAAADSEWTTLLAWREDHGSFRALPGERARVSLLPYAGQKNLMLRFRYYADGSAPTSRLWYTQIDDIQLVCDQRPVLQLAPTALDLHAAVGAAFTRTLTIGNGGTLPLTWQILDAAPGQGSSCASISYIGYLTMSASSGTVDPAAATDVTLWFDLAGVAPGLYEELLCVYSNDPLLSVQTLPVTLTVSAVPTAVAGRQVTTVPAGSVLTIIVLAGALLALATGAARRRR